VLVHSNHFLSNVPVFDREKSHAALTLLRPSRVRHLLHDAVREKRVAINDLIKVFRDHYSFPNGICRHEDARDPMDDRYQTVYSVIMDLTVLDFWIAAGPPCESPYVQVDAHLSTMS
jgi:isopenicillin-N N-acyltransferase-like protein